MPQCAKCRDFFPPDFCVMAEDEDKLCLFCKRDIKEIKYSDNKVVTREEIVEEYKKFTKMLKEDLTDPFSGELKKRDFTTGKTEEESRIIKPFR